jgi:hypothetical protein
MYVGARERWSHAHLLQQQEGVRQHRYRPLQGCASQA